jgi:hypothetical protein
MKSECSLDLNFLYGQGVEHFLIYLLAILSNLFLHLLIGLFLLLLFNFLSSLHILDINHLSIACFVKVFSHSVGCLLILVIVSFDVQKLFNLMQSYLFIFPG